MLRETFAEASEAVGFDLWHIAQTGEGLDQTEFTQPVLLTASIALWRVWLELGGVAPKYLAGHSLGEYSALVAAGSSKLRRCSQAGELAWQVDAKCCTSRVRVQWQRSWV